jgi:hypothetical protein
MGFKKRTGFIGALTGTTIASRDERESVGGTYVV